MVFFDYEDRLFREKVRMVRTRVLSALGRDGVYFSRSGCVSAIGSRSPTICVVDSRRDGMRFIVRADEKLTAFVGLDTTQKLGIVSDRQRLVA
jgi:hypothetical protein